MTLARVGPANQRSETGVGGRLAMASLSAVGGVVGGGRRDGYGRRRRGRDMSREGVEEGKMGGEVGGVKCEV